MAIAKRIPLLVFILLVGTLLRFWNLDLKPLWMDEVITALFSFGRTYYDVPLEAALPVSTLKSIFTLNPTASCAQIALTVSTQSVHPPLFFCWMHDWLRGLDGLPISWVWKLRALPAIFGVVAIAALYCLNRLAFSTRAGLIGAALMATSPFAVYLSQEARHYTLPMLLVILALVGLYQMLLDLQQRRCRLWLWLGWVTVNGLGFYVHYFFLLAFAAQAATLLVGQWVVVRGAREQRITNIGHLRPWLLPTFAIALVCLLYLPWFPTFLSHIGRPETDWVKVKASGVIAAISPLLQIVTGWTLTTIALPVEGQPFGISILSGGLMAVFSGWLAWRVGRGLWQLWQNSQTRLATQMLVLFSAFVIVEFLAIAYLLGKDFTQVPRYNFIYFPAICALIGAGLSQPLPANSKPSYPSRFTPRQLVTPVLRLGAIGDLRSVMLVLLVSTLSSVLVISNQVFQKPYQPDQVASTWLFEPQYPTLVTMAYSDFQDIALGLGFGLELARQQQQNPHPTEPYFALLGQIDGYERVWRNLSLLPHPLPLPLNLWVIGPGLKRVGYRQTLSLSDAAGNRQTCQIDPNYFRRIGIPYQLYRCR
ncbi:MAG: glycosyltransferase family 39 protein [Leptolyngbyaceae cyanobacterium bins.349]|nr:glycosyltransferase family 39 protein [Leptolyngbyaceae cyanobacterium bins.349]